MKDLITKLDSLNESKETMDADELQELVYDTFNKLDGCNGQDGTYLWCDSDVDHPPLKNNGTISGHIFVDVYDSLSNEVYADGSLYYHTDNDMEVESANECFEVFSVNDDIKTIQQKAENLTNKLMNEIDNAYKYVE